MFRAYFDESGTHGKARITAIAGFVAAADVWVALTSEWNEILGRLANRGVTWLHTTDCHNGTKQFSGIPYSERQNLIAYLAGVISRNDVWAVWAGVNNADFERITGSNAEFRERFPKPYDLCFDEVVRQLWWWSRHHAGSTRVPVVFAAQEEYADRNRDAYSAWRNHPHAGQFLGDLTFDFPQVIVPLQAADMVAYQTAKEWEGLEYGEVNAATNFQMRPILHKITERRAMHSGGLYGELGLKNAVARFHATGGL